MFLFPGRAVHFGLNKLIMTSPHKNLVCEYSELPLSLARVPTNLLELWSFSFLFQHLLRDGWCRRDQLLLFMSNYSNDTILDVWRVLLSMINENSWQRRWESGKRLNFDSLNAQFGPILILELNYGLLYHIIPVICFRLAGKSWKYFWRKWYSYIY